MLDISIETIGGRIRFIRLSQEVGKLSLEKMAEALGISKAQLLTYELNKVTPSDAILKLICVTYNVDYKWLKDGDGLGPFVEHEDAASLVDHLLAGQSDVAKVILAEACRVLDDHAWQKIGEMVQAVAQRLREKQEERE